MSCQILMKGTSRSKKVTPGRAISTKQCTYNDGKISAFADIPDRFCDQYVIENCPIASWDGFRNFNKVSEVVITNAFFSNFKNCMSETVKRVTLTGAPVTRYPLYRVMALLAFGNQLTTLDGVEISAAERELVATYNTNGQLSALVRSGVILTKIGPEVVQDSECKVPAAPQGCDAVVECRAAYEAFFDAKSLKAAEDEVMKGMPATKEVVDEVEIRRCLADIRVLYGKLVPGCRLVPLFHEFEDVYARFPKDVEEMANVYGALNQIGEIIKTSQKGIFDTLDEEVNKFKVSADDLRQCPFAEYCTDFIEVCNKFVSVARELLNTPGIDIDILCDNLSKFEAIEQSRVGPFRRILEDIEKAVQEKSKNLDQNQRAALERKFFVAKRCALDSHIRALVETLKSCGPEFQPETDRLSTASTSFPKIRKWYSTPPSPENLKRHIETCHAQLTQTLMQKFATLVSHSNELQLRLSENQKRHASEVSAQLGHMSDLKNWFSEVQSVLSSNETVTKCCSEMSLRSDIFFRYTLQNQTREFDKSAALLEQSITEKDAEISAFKQKTATSS